jgi:hypothetical protein
MFMNKKIQRIQSKLGQTRARLLTVVEGLAAECWDWRPQDGRWSARLTLAHVGSAQWDHLEVARRMVAGEPTAVPNFDLDTWNNARVGERSHWSVEQVLADLEAAQRATIGFLESISDADLATAGTHPVLGETSVGQVIRLIPLHDNLHRRDLLRLVQEMPAES